MYVIRICEKWRGRRSRYLKKLLLLLLLSSHVRQPWYVYRDVLQSFLGIMMLYLYLLGRLFNWLANEPRYNLHDRMSAIISKDACCFSIMESYIWWHYHLIFLCFKQTRREPFQIMDSISRPHYLKSFSVF